MTPLIKLLATQYILIVCAVIAFVIGKAIGFEDTFTEEEKSEPFVTKAMIYKWCIPFWWAWWIVKTGIKYWKELP